MIRVMRPWRGMNRAPVVAPDRDGFYARQRLAPEGNRMPKKIIIDCDPGLDDAIAILLAAGNPDVEIVAVTTVAGNHTLDKVTLNARQVCTLVSLHDVPVAPGADRPLVRDRITAAEIHGESGMDGPAFITPAMEADPGTPSTSSWRRFSPTPARSRSSPPRP